MMDACVLLIRSPTVCRMSDRCLSGTFGMLRCCRKREPACRSIVFRPAQQS